MASLFCKKAMVWEDTLNFSTTEFAKGPQILNMVMTFVLTPWSHYNTITEPRTQFLLSLMEDLSIDFASHMIVSMIYCYQDTATRDKFIFPSAITCILSHMHVTIPLSSPFNIMGAISKESIRRSDAQLVPKQPRVKEDAALTPCLSSSSTLSSSSSRVEASVAAIIDQLQHMRADFGSHLNHISNEMCQMNTRIGRIARRQSYLGNFAPSPSPELADDSSLDGGDDDDEDASGSKYEDEMTPFQ